jgi:quercetin dioxygenase-like cupin family protein
VRPMISRPGDGERFDRENRAVTIRIDLPQLSIHELEFDTTFEVARHTHEHVDTMYVLDGEVEFLAGDAVVRAGPGTLFTAPPGAPHGFRNPGPDDARVLILHAPDGGFAEMIRQT